MFNEHDLRQALATCFVPALRRDVIAAALVQSATLTLDADAPGAGIPGVPARHIARVILRAPGSDEAVNAGMRAAVENRLLGVPEISRAEISLLPALFSILSQP